MIYLNRKKKKKTTTNSEIVLRVGGRGYVNIGLFLFVTIFSSSHSL